MKPTNEQLRAAVRASSSRLAKMSPEQLAELINGARRRIFPNGYWKCDCAGPVQFLVPAGRCCFRCERKEPVLSRLKRWWKGNK